MPAPSPNRFTGKHMAVTMVAGFGVVAAVNFYMASQAVGGFHGVVVENSYVASQKFNQWSEEADRMADLEWSATAVRIPAGRLALSTTGVPQGAVISAQLRRPIGTKEFAQLSFSARGDGRYLSAQPVSQGRWTMRLTIEAQGQRWVEESELK